MAVPIGGRPGDSATASLAIGHSDWDQLSLGYTQESLPPRLRLDIGGALSRRIR